MASNVLKYLTLIILLAGALSLIYFVNVKILAGGYYHYWGINYYLNGLKNESYEAWQKSFRFNNPYMYGARQDFATMIQQGFKAGIIFEPIAEVHKEGIEEIKKNIAEQPENYFYYNFLAEYYNAFSKFNPSYLDEAEKMAAKAWELSPNRQQVLYSMAKTALLRGDMKKGYELFEQAIALNPSAGDPHFYFGLLALERGDVKKGLAEIEFAQKTGRQPRSMQEAILMANLIGDSGNYKKAIELYEYALKNLKDDANYQIWSLDTKLKLGIAYYYDGDNVKAREVLDGLAKEIDLIKFPVYQDLKPILTDLGII